MLKLKNFMKMGMTTMLSMVMLSSYFDMPFCGPSIFFFGEPKFPFDKN